VINQCIFETSQDLILITDRKGTFIRVSPSAMSILGYEPDEMVGRSGAEFLYCEDLDNTRNEMRMSRRAGLTQNFECRYVHKQGRIVTLWWTGVWSPSEQQYFFTGRDITDRKETERRLRQSESRFQDIAEVSGDWIWETDRSHRFRLLLGDSTDGLPVRPETLIGRTRWEVAGANPEIDELWAGHKAHLDSHQPFRNFHYEIRVSSGVSMFIRASGKPVFDDENNFLGYRGTATDETAVFEAQRRVRLSEDRFRSIFSAVSEGIFIISPTTGIFTEANESGCAMFGYTSDELIGGDMPMISSGAPPFTQRDAMEWHEKAVASGRPQRFEWHCRAKDGRLFWAEVSIRFVAISGEEVVLATVRDVTERRTVEAQLRQAQKMEAIGNLTGGMAHDFNNLLGVVVGNLDLARERSRSDEELQELIDEALEAAWRGADLTRHLLAFARRQPLRTRFLSRAAAARPCWSSRIIPRCAASCCARFASSVISLLRAMAPQQLSKCSSANRSACCSPISSCPAVWAAVSWRAWRGNAGRR
jgi:PAS domain S-box-containing protein